MTKKIYFFLVGERSGAALLEEDIFVCQMGCGLLVYLALVCFFVIQ
jgi:hypothetical protein